MFNRIFFTSTALWLVTSQVQAAAIVEKTGRFEINWSTGKVRFYGTSIMDPNQSGTWRNAEQSAWSDGITYLQKNMPQTLASRSGMPAFSAAKIANAMAVTSSVTTTYFGDSRIKVSLESSVPELFKQVAVDAPKGQALASGSAQALVVKVTCKASPTAVFSVVDETGASLLSGNDMAATALANSTVARWYKSRAEVSGTKEVPDNTPEIKATAPSPGVLKVARADWKPEYASSIASGRAAIVVP